jgi:hypothetical protein
MSAQNSISGWDGLSPAEQKSLADMQEAAEAFAQTHADPMKFAQPQQGGQVGQQMPAMDPAQPTPPGPSPMAPLPMPSKNMANTNAGALHFDGNWVRGKDGNLHLVKTNEWREQ